MIDDTPDPSIAIQDAVETALRNSVAVMQHFEGFLVKLYTLSAPSGCAYPYIIIGEDQIVGDDTECASSSEIYVDIHVWAREATPAESRLKAKAIAGGVRKTLTSELPLTGHVMDDWNYEGTRHLSDKDALTAHSLLTFRYLTTACACRA